MHCGRFMPCVARPVCLIHNTFIFHKSSSGNRNWTLMCSPFKLLLSFVVRPVNPLRDVVDLELHLLLTVTERMSVAIEVTLLCLFLLKYSKEDLQAYSQAFRGYPQQAPHFFFHFSKLFIEKSIWRWRCHYCYFSDAELLIKTVCNIFVFIAFHWDWWKQFSVMWRLWRRNQRLQPRQQLDEALPIYLFTCFELNALVCMLSFSQWQS